MKKERKHPNEMSFFEHLAELRKRLFYSLLALIIAFAISWNFSKDIYNFLSKPVLKFLPEGEKLAFTSIVDPFIMYLKISFLAGIFLASPFIFLQLWLFISPGLYPHEKKYVVPFVFFTTLFFISGGAFGYYVLFPIVCKFFLSLGSDFRPVITIKQYFDLIIKVLLAIGVVFEIPTVTFLLSRLGIITPKFLIKNLGIAVLVIFIIAAIITPTGDIITQTIMAIPMLVLYLISILVAFIFQRREKKELKG
ncbi:MAG: twin-arginine translocase subunit TatC [Candidatus Aminicenantia bacterium]